MRFLETLAELLPIRLLDLLRRHLDLPSCFGSCRECCPPAWSDVRLRQPLPAPIARRSVGHPTATSDDQRIAEQLVQEGVDEAEHHSMLAGSTHDTNQNS